MVMSLITSAWPVGGLKSVIEMPRVGEDLLAVFWPAPPGLFTSVLVSWITSRPSTRRKLRKNNQKNKSKHGK